MTLTTAIVVIVDYKNTNKMIEVINAKVGLNKVTLRARLTLEELEAKTPHKKQLIRNQKDSLQELEFANTILHRLDLKVMAMSSQLFSQNRLLLELQEQNTKYKQTIENLLNDDNEILKDAEM